MKYIITESKLDEAITNYLNKLFDVDDINWTGVYDYDDDGNESEDETRTVFYVGDFSDGDICFYWSSCDYFNNPSPAQDICPTITVEVEYEEKLNGYFGDIWHGPFKRWFTQHFDLPVKTID